MICSKKLAGAISRLKSVFALPDETREETDEEFEKRRENLHTPEEWLEIVKEKGYYGLRDVPEKLKTLEMCLIAISHESTKKYPHLTTYLMESPHKPIPDKFKTPSFIEKALELNPAIYPYLSKDIRGERPAEELIQRVQSSSTSELLFDLYSLNFLKEEELEDSQLVDFLWKDTLIKAKQFYVKQLLFELKDEVATTIVPIIYLQEPPDPHLQNWFRKDVTREKMRRILQRVDSSLSEELRESSVDWYLKQAENPSNWFFDPDYNEKASVDDYIHLFSGIDWEEGYGGEPWAKIALYTKKLMESTSPEDIMHTIDVLNHLAHNTGSILNKWIKNPEILLDAKAHKESLRIMYPFCSPDVKRLFREYFRGHLRSAVSKLRLVLASFTH